VKFVFRSIELYRLALGFYNITLGFLATFFSCRPTIKELLLAASADCESGNIKSREDVRLRSEG
jgi:hypothetical protein